MATLLNGKAIPNILYGTARRAQKPLPNISAALHTGYRAIDTASSRSFHHEAEEGEAIATFLSNNEDISRQDLFIQSKYAPHANHIDPVPFDTSDNTTVCVLKSVLRSSTELKIDVIDAYFLHSQLSSLEMALEAWLSLESIVERGGIRYLGMANVRISRLRNVYDSARVKPTFVQNWFRHTNEYDREVVTFCKEKGIVYQVFGVFDTENAFLLSSKSVQWLARENSTTDYQALLQMLLAGASAIGLQICILDGTTNENHMKENLSAVRQSDDLDSAEIEEFLRLIGWA